MNGKVRIALAEAIGTMILVVGGPGTAILTTGYFTTRKAAGLGVLKTLPGNVGILGVSLAFGLALLVAAYAIGNISGCHINPAVTIGLWVIGKTERALVPFYVVGQVVGGVIGGFIIFTIARSSDIAWTANQTGFASNGFDTHSPGGFSVGAAIVAEVIFTAIFVFIIASTTRRSMTPGFTGLVVGLALTLIHLVLIPIDNASVNPARSLATAVFQRTWALEQLWVFIVFPLIGGILGAVVWRALCPSDDA
jgi:aquaporin Z